jgi:guanylate kinase
MVNPALAPAFDGLLYVISGPSGSGKTSLCTALLDRCPRLKMSVSATTRPPRPGEINGINYHFLDAKSFDDQLAEGRFLEHAMVHGHAYGTRLADVEAMLADGYDVLLEIDWQGAAQVAARCHNTCRIFILPPSIEELRRRLTGRGQDDMQVIEQRVAAAASEMEHAGEADYRIVNEVFDQALAQLLNIYHKHSGGR